MYYKNYRYEQKVLTSIDGFVFKFPFNIAKEGKKIALTSFD